MWSIALVLISSVIVALGDVPAVSAAPFEASTVGNSVVWLESAASGEWVRMAFTPTGHDGSGRMVGTLSGTVIHGGSVASANEAVYQGTATLVQASRRHQQSNKSVLVTLQVDSVGLDRLSLHAAGSALQANVEVRLSDSFGRALWHLG